VAAALKRVGFDTIVGIDLDKAAMDEATIRFARAVRDADVAIFYYSGHALQFAGVNYLIPIDATLSDEADLRRMMRVDEIVVDLQKAAKVRILVLDSCRNNPLVEDMKRSIGLTRAASLPRGLARIDAPQGMIVAYATQAGATAADGTDRNSPYTQAFLRHIETQEEIGTIFRRVSAEVYEATKHAQLPELSLSLIGEFYLYGPPAVSANGGPGAAERAWAEVKDTKNPVVLKEFVSRFGDSFYATLARNRLDELQSTRVTLAAPPVLPRPAEPCSNVPEMASLSSRASQPLSRAEECALKPKDIFKECEKCPEMVVVPAGQFMMGSPPNEPNRLEREGPQHQVMIERPFAVGKFHVTVDQFAMFVAETGYDAGTRCSTEEDGKFEQRDRSWRNPGFNQGASHPAVCLSWNDATAYASWLSRTTGGSYRLLTEAEWEYAARAETTTPFFFGDNEKDFCRYGNGFDQTGKALIPSLKNRPTLPCNDRHPYAAPVGSFLPNRFGLYDMHGNAWQWVEDCSHESYQGAPSDGAAWASGECNIRIRRGGYWLNVSPALRSASRLPVAAGFRGQSTGFRLARTL
jgi:formylglycine-generating enzyme required for sulfatase activity